MDQFVDQQALTPSEVVSLPVQGPDSLASDMTSMSDLLSRKVEALGFLDESGLIPSGNVTALYGEGGVGKSQLAMAWGLSGVSGLSVSGLKLKPCKVFGMFCEDDLDVLTQRAQAHHSAYQFLPSDLEHFHVWCRVGQDNALWKDDGGGTSLYAQLTEKLNKVAAQGDTTLPILIIIDTLAHVFRGNENDRAHVTAFVGEVVQDLAQRYGAVLMLGHPAKNEKYSKDGYSGSTAWHGSVRSRLMLRKEPGGIVKLSHEKSNYGDKNVGLNLEWRNGCFQEAGYTQEDLQILINHIQAEAQAGSGYTASGKLRSLFARRAELPKPWTNAPKGRLEAVVKRLVDEKRLTKEKDKTLVAISYLPDSLVSI